MVWRRQLRQLGSQNLDLFVIENLHAGDVPVFFPECELILTEPVPREITGVPLG